MPDRVAPGRVANERASLAQARIEEKWNVIRVQVIRAHGDQRAKQMVREQRPGRLRDGLLEMWRQVHQHLSIARLI